MITSPLVNAAANLCLKAVDFTLKFSLAPHTNKTAYFDDILAQALNVLQVGVLFKFVKDKADGVVKGEGLGGDSAGVFFVGGALAAIGPALFTAMYECFWKLVVLYRKILLAKAKMKDTKKMLDNARKNTDAKRNEFLLKKALMNVFTKESENLVLESDANLDSGAVVQLTPAAMQEFKIMFDLLTRHTDLFKAAKEIRNQYLKKLAKRLAKSLKLKKAEPHNPLSNIVCLVKALQTVMNDPSSKVTLTVRGKDLLFKLLQLPAGLDLNADPDAVAIRLNSESFTTENIDRFRELMQMCSDFDPEKGREYYRKAKLVLSYLPYTQEPLPDGAGNKKQEVVLSVKCSFARERDI